MKETVMRCDCCGKIFYSEYWTGGYIDHYINYARHFDSMIKREEEDIFDAIYTDGNKIRERTDVKCRLRCFEKYCEQNNAVEKFEKVKALVELHLIRQKKLDKIHDKIVDMVCELSEEEKEYIGLEYQEFCSKRLTTNPTEKGGVRE